MLRDLHVENLAVISEASVEFEPGLNALTGETGAGKSIVVDALALLSGARASADLIRTGAKSLSITGVFEPSGEAWRSVLNAAGFDVGGSEIVVRREVNREGRNRVYLNDRPVSLGLLASVGEYLIQIHTQREELDLVYSEVQREWLDRCGGDEGERLRDKVASLFEIYDHLADRLVRARGDEESRVKRVELLQYQINEIDSASLQQDEDVELKQERGVLRNAEAILEALIRSYSRLFEDEGSAVEQVSVSGRDMQEIEAWESLGKGWSERLEQVQVNLQELSIEIRGRIDEVAADPKRLDAVEERLALIDRLCRKYGDSVAAVLEYRRTIGGELEELELDVDQQDKLSVRVDEAFEDYLAAATELSEARQKWGRDLSERVESELADLALDQARFEVQLDTLFRDGSRLVLAGRPRAFGREGFDRVNFRLAANPGEGMSPLARSASGGELSRIYLAVQLASRGTGPAVNPTLVFDEVDAGIGGAEAAALGQKLARLADGGQILVVSHLPQVASSGDVHFRVCKTAKGDRTLTSVDRLDEEQRVEEVARMLGGRELTSLSISHAEEMIDTTSGRDDI